MCVGFRRLSPVQSNIYLNPFTQMRDAIKTDQVINIKYKKSELRLIST